MKKKKGCRKIERQMEKKNISLTTLSGQTTTIILATVISSRISYSLHHLFHDFN